MQVQDVASGAQPSSPVPFSELFTPPPVLATGAQFTLKFQFGADATTRTNNQEVAVVSKSGFQLPPSAPSDGVFVSTPTTAGSQCMHDCSPLLRSLRGVAAQHSVFWLAADHLG